MKVKQWTIKIVSIMTSICLLLSLMHFASSSLEMLSVEEQQGESRLAATILISAFVILEMTL